MLMADDDDERTVETVRASDERTPFPRQRPAGREIPNGQLRYCNDTKLRDICE